MTNITLEMIVFIPYFTLISTTYRSKYIVKIKWIMWKVVSKYLRQLRKGGIEFLILAYTNCFVDKMKANSNWKHSLSHYVGKCFALLLFKSYRSDIVYLLKLTFSC